MDLVLRGALVCDGAAAPAAATVVVRERLVAAVEPPGISVHAEQVVELAGHLLVPGLIDAHTHLLMAGDVDGYEKELLKDGLPLRTLRAAAHARMALDHGFLTLRDVCTEGAGYADVALREAIRAGVCEGPRILPSGPGIGITGGYLPRGFAPGVCVPSGCAIVDGEDAARREVREQVSYGVAWIKVFADWPSSDATTGESKDRPTFTRGELGAIVDEAERRGVRVAAHVTSDAGARQAIEAGVASLEHMGSLTRETLDAAAARGVALVPTLSVLEQMLEHLPVADETRRDRARRRIEASRAAFAHALAAGVTIVCGTDIGVFPHSIGSRGELALLADYGMSAIGALAAATRNAADLLRLAPLGRIEPGAPADLCAFAGTALETAIVERPVLVLQSGRIIRNRLA